MVDFAEVLDDVLSNGYTAHILRCEQRRLLHNTSIIEIVYCAVTGDHVCTIFLAHISEEDY